MTPNPLLTDARGDLHTGTCCANQFCRACGSHVSGYNCNSALGAQRKEAQGVFDYWYACDNAKCLKDHGEGGYSGDTLPA